MSAKGIGYVKNLTEVGFSLVKNSMKKNRDEITLNWDLGSP